MQTSNVARNLAMFAGILAFTAVVLFPQRTRPIVTGDNLNRTEDERKVQRVQLSKTRERVGCAVYLLQIDHEKRRMLEEGATPRDFPLPQCPGGGVYTVGERDQFPRCSILDHNLQ